MAARSTAVGVVFSCLVGATGFAAPAHEGAWVGGFWADGEPVFVRVVLAGEGEHATGRIDFPVLGERAILLKSVSASSARVGFEVPAQDGGHLRFDGELTADRITGIVRQGAARSRFELHRGTLRTDQGFPGLEGTYEFPTGDVLLTYAGADGPRYINHRTGRMGTLYRLDEDHYVSGPTVVSGFPFEVHATFERDVAGRVRSVRWQEGGTTATAERRDFYDREPVTIANGDVRLSGELLLPHGVWRAPAVVMVQGSGYARRSALLPMADVLARQGVAVLIHDKRGVGESTGNLARASFDDLAGDALAAVAWLRGHGAINPAQIGLLGASLGGWVAPLAASRAADIAFVIVEAAPATTPAEHERQRVLRQMLADGQPREAIAMADHYMTRKFEVGRTGRGWEQLQSLTERARREGWVRYVNAPSSLESLTWQWAHVLSYDPRAALETLRCPVFALYGERDTIVAPAVHADRMRDVLGRAVTRDVTVQVMPGANHHFLSALSGGPGETGRLRDFVPGYFDRHVSWLRARFATAAARSEPPATAFPFGDELYIR